MGPQGPQLRGTQAKRSSIGPIFKPYWVKGGIGGSFLRSCGLGSSTNLSTARIMFLCVFCKQTHEHQYPLEFFHFQYKYYNSSLSQVYSRAKNIANIVSAVSDKYFIHGSLCKVGYYNRKLCFQLYPCTSSIVQT